MHKQFFSIYIKGVKQIVSLWSQALKNPVANQDETQTRLRPWENGKLALIAV